MSVTPRWLEGMIRLSIARARLLLHPRVTDDDALHAVNLVERMLNTVAVDQATKKVDVGVLSQQARSEKGLGEAPSKCSSDFPETQNSRSRTRPSTRRWKRRASSQENRPRRCFRTCGSPVSSSRSERTFSKRHKGQFPQDYLGLDLSFC